MGRSSQYVRMPTIPNPKPTLKHLSTFQISQKCEISQPVTKRRLQDYAEKVYFYNDFLHSLCMQYFAQKFSHFMKFRTLSLLVKYKAK